MKKIMLLAAVAVAAFASQAASIKWTTDALYAPNADGSFSSTMLKDSTTAYTISVAMKFYTADGTEITSITSGLSSDTVSSKNGKVTGTTAGYDFLVTDYQYSAHFELVMDGKTYTMDIDPTTFSQTKTTGNFALTVPTSSAWTPETTDVPEPTSGLLLLVGAAGLALRRRRA